MKENLRGLFSIAVFVLMLSAVTRAEIFTAYLTGAQENPPVATTATGYARIFVNESTGQLTFTVVFNNLSSNQTASHIHAPAPIGANVGVAINFGAVGGTSGTITGTTTITPTQLAQLRAHLGYVNVHSANFTGGEIRGQLGVQRPLDYDGDGRTDLSIVQTPDIVPRGGDDAQMIWWNSTSTSGTQVVSWGDAFRDSPAPGDYDGDGKADIAVFRSTPASPAPSEFWILQSSNNAVRYFAWGIYGDLPVQRDYDGDGITDIAVIRDDIMLTESKYWYIRESSTGNVRVEIFGYAKNDMFTTRDVPVPGDYDGDGKTDLAVYRFRQFPFDNFIVKRSSDGIVTYQPFGNYLLDWIVPGDYDGDGKTDLAVARRGATADTPLVWWIQQSSNGQIRVQTFGLTSDRPAQGDYDGDARTDIAIFRYGVIFASEPHRYWIYRSFDNTPQVLSWGIGLDQSVNTFDIR